MVKSFYLLILLFLVSQCKTKLEPSNEQVKLMESRRLMFSNIFQSTYDSCIDIKRSPNGLNLGCSNPVFAFYLDSDFIYRRVHGKLADVYEDKSIYKLIKKKHSIEVLGFQQISKKKFNFDGSYKILIEIDGDTFSYPFISTQNFEAPQIDKIIWDIDFFWEAYKDEPLVCEKIAIILSNGLYNVGQNARFEIFHWLEKMMRYQNSSFAAKEYCKNAQYRMSGVSVKNFDHKIIKLLTKSGCDKKTITKIATLYYEHKNTVEAIKKKGKRFTKKTN